MTDLVFRTTDMTRWGLGKGANLDAVEVDLNFWELLSRLIDLETNPALPREIDHITVVDDQMTIVMSDLTTEFGPFTLPSAEFNFRGDWLPATAYKKNDLFLSPVYGLFLVLQDHTSEGAPFNPDSGNMAGPYAKLMLPFPNVYDIGFFAPGTPGAGIVDGGVLFMHRFARAAFMLAELPGSVGGLEFENTDDIVCPLYKNHTLIGDFTIPANSETETSEGIGAGIYTFADDVQFFPNDRFRVLRPATLDLTARDLTMTIVATKGLLV